ncbi:DUF937 domain-containing protein [Zeaxanthinibacter sp. PT1]|uniref:DUF937 domain-containing protein n=1 Tax=Zeaxanthinibacter TaxID=561554 RepID=UPI00234AE9FE|nr:DUF937 domain-containing protein [Zeaxanthinibacter sp. PT1]MDC6351615.1 DUF937 domain-containing protein [Zeaxanthinibacter sp. PT1]
MAGILDLLQSSEGKQMIQGLSRETGAPAHKTADVLSMALPLLLGGMKKNATDEKGAESLMNALNSSKHDGSILNNLGSLFEGGVDDRILKDGAGILGHVFGKKQAPLEQALSQKSGLDTATIAKILKVAAPVIMGYLAKQKSKHDVSDTGSMNSLLGGLLGGQPEQNQSLLMSLIDADGDGSVLDDVADMVMGNKKKGGGIGGMLGGLFGK